jgi:hypothetical protein
MTMTARLSTRPPDERPIWQADGVGDSGRERSGLIKVDLWNARGMGLHRTAVIASVTLAVLAVAGVAAASIPDSNGVITACRRTTSGELRVIDTATTASCPNGWTRLTWSQTGPAGAAGPSGPAGATGPAGPQGAPGLAGVHVVEQTRTDSGGGFYCTPDQVSETALSIVFDEPQGQTAGHSYYVHPLLDPTGRPVGYNVLAQPLQYQALQPWSFHMTCAVTG